MCGRFALKMLDGFLREHPWILPPTFVPDGAGGERYNIAPTQPVAAVLGDGDGSAHVEYVKWGLVPSWATDPAVGGKMINARSETLAEKPAYRKLLGSRRCLVIADGFYEWKTESQGVKTKTPYFVRLRSGEPFALAGLWDSWRDPTSSQWLRSCTIITAEPNDLVSQFHHRMAVIVRPEMYRRWVREAGLPADELAKVFTPYPADGMEAYPVSTAVNSAAAQGAKLTERFEPARPAQGTLF